ncbi:MAG: hypothetical protein KDB03_25030 [Planctomycetales bacterium]|nr:hypothetical protein [Planctomycetales bacterium]
MKTVSSKVIMLSIVCLPAACLAHVPPPLFAPHFTISNGRIVVAQYRRDSEAKIRQEVFDAMMANAQNRIGALRLSHDVESRLIFAAKVTNWRLLREMNFWERDIQSHGLDEWFAIERSAFKMLAKVRAAPFLSDSLLCHVARRELSAEQFREFNSLLFGNSHAR